ncbi:hypothetical protein F4803DRAFT_569634 [Xylaria telfairii]|nr:hypothetical protein F4803DRAFT_569634 [Xylaria telfairii]
MAAPSGNENAGSGSISATPDSYLDHLPDIAVAQIYNELPQEDRLRLAISYPHIQTFTRYYNTVCFFADNDIHLDRVKAAANEFIRLNHVEGLTRLLRSSIRGRRNSPLTRAFLLNVVKSDVLDGDNLRYAIQYRESETVAFIAQSMLSRGQSPDEPIPRGPWHSDTGHWCHTPLTYALARESYLEAAMLLSSGADVDRIPPNIRHRVLVVRNRIMAGATDITAFVYRDPDHNVFTTSDVHIAEWALNYVFARLLFDPSHPVPNYARTRRHPNLPLDHPDNDSDGE